jgi:hypothetical protein
MLIRFDPEFVKYTVDEPPSTATNTATKYYTITDHMDALPRAIWDATVSFNAEITDISNGIEWVIKAPLGLVQTSVWTIEPALDTDGDADTKLCLVEDVVISCSRLLVGTVKSKCESNWSGIHAKFVQKLGAKDP